MGGRPAIIEQRPASLVDTELVARVFRVLGERSRLAILELLLADGELHQAEVIRRLGLSQARASEHLSCLCWCGLVETRAEGRRTLYRVTNPLVGRLLSLGRQLLEDNEAQIAACRRIDDKRGTS